MIKYEFRDACHPKYIKANGTDELIKDLRIEGPCIENQILFAFSCYGRYREGEVCHRTRDLKNDNEIFTSVGKELYGLNAETNMAIVERMSSGSMSKTKNFIRSSVFLASDIKNYISGQFLIVDCGCVARI